MLEEELIKMMKLYENFERDLELVQSLNLPYACIAAGYVRNFVWDQLHGYTKRTPLNDIDVIYFDKNNVSENFEKEIEAYLSEKTNCSIWSVKNQARMHVNNGDPPYHSISDAMSKWPETVTAVGMTKDEEGNIKVIAPYGVDDIFNMKVRRSPLFKNKEYVRKRVINKNWKNIWPMIEIEWD